MTSENNHYGSGIERREPAGAVFARWDAKVRELKAWEEQFPELSAAWDEANEEEHKRECKKRREQNEREILATCGEGLHRMGVPARTAGDLEKAIRSGLVETQAMKAARDFVASKQALLVLFGGPGSGKTLAASWCLLRARSVKLYDEEEFRLDPGKGTFVRGSVLARIPRFEDGGAWDRLLRIRWLVIDDLGAQKGGEFFDERINELIDTRYGECLRTIITCNVTPDDFKRNLGDRISSRIKGDGMVVGCGDDDLRVRRAAQ